MEIRLDRTHVLYSDKYSCWIAVKIVSKNGKVYERRVSGYMPTFHEAVVSYINMAVNSSGSAELWQLKEDIENLKKEVMSWKSVLND